MYIALIAIFLTFIKIIIDMTIKNSMINLKYEIFASYSHHDVKIVKPIIQLLKPSVNVFIDGEAIIPGLKWAVVIGNAIQDCRLMYVFWCNHSSRSVEVKKEYDQAISLDKDIVPVLIDNTPLPKKLKNYQC
ncbi:MAG: toll/interleukin-1 receptor domain-containing protein [Draconibacterium sp.]|nr:toll/interleukin-1 receptor domain-containing protein [Draconibacterium sp.]